MSVPSYVALARSQALQSIEMEKEKPLNGFIIECRNEFLKVFIILHFYSSASVVLSFEIWLKCLPTGSMRCIAYCTVTHIRLESTEQDYPSPFV
jgi:hypothetical protein